MVIINNFSNNIQFLNNNIDNNNIKILPGNTSTQQYQFLQPKKFLSYISFIYVNKRTKRITSNFSIKK